MAEDHEHAHGDREDLTEHPEDAPVSDRTDHPAVDHPVDWLPHHVVQRDEPYNFVRGISSNRYDYKDTWEELRDPENRVVKGSELPIKSRRGDIIEGSQTWGKHFVNPTKGLTQSLTTHVKVLAPEGKSQKHAHQNEAMMYILEGRGYEIHDGERYEWEAGDLVVIHGGSVHQHFSADPDNPCKALIVKPKPLTQLLHLIYQGTVEPTPEEPSEHAGWTPPEPYVDGNGNTVYPSERDGTNVDAEGSQPQAETQTGDD